MWRTTLFIFGILLNNIALAEICDPNPGGSYCGFTAQATPSKSDKIVIHCGNTPVWISERQQQVIDQYLDRDQTLVLQWQRGGEFIAAPCHL